LLTSFFAHLYEIYSCVCLPLTQNRIHDIIKVIHRNNIHFFFDIVRQISDISIVPCRENDGGDPGAMSSQHFFLDPADGQDAPAQGQLSGGGDIFLGRSVV